MDAVKEAPSVAGGMAVKGVADAAVGRGLPSASTAPLTSNPQAVISEGLETATALDLVIRPTLSAAPALTPALSSHIPTKGHTSPNLLHGPVPQKGSGQDRFRQLLMSKKENNQPRLTPAAHSTSFPVNMGAPLRLMAAPSYSPGVTSVAPPPFTLYAAASACPSTQGPDRAMVAPSYTKTEMPRAIKAEVKSTPLAKLPKQPNKPPDNAAHGQKTSGSGGVVRDHPLPTARLSAQCQLRRFNPKWHEKSGPKGFTCSVQLVDKHVRIDRAYETANDAKQAVAEKALAYVCQLPCKNPSGNVAMRIKTSGTTHRVRGRHRGRRAPAKKESSAGASRDPINDAYTQAAPVRAPVPYNWNMFNYNEEQSALLHRIQTAFGGAGPSPQVLADPLAAQAFLQGLAVGTSVRAAGSTYNPYVEPRSQPYPPVTGDLYRPYEARERSPAPDPNSERNYRDRSSPHRPTSHGPIFLRLN